MSVEVGRRVFVGSVALGVPMLAGVGVQRAWAQREKPGSPQADPVLRQLLVDMKRAVRRLSRSPSGEHVRQLSSSFRLLAAWGASAQLDQRIKDSLRGVVAREGRESLLSRPVDPEKLKSEARDFGFDGTSAVALPAFAAPDYQTRSRVLDDMLANGATARWREFADLLDNAAAAVDQRAAAQQGSVTLVAQGNPQQCISIQQTLGYLNAQMTFWCAPWFFWFPEGCGLTTSAYLGALGAYWWAGCW